MQGNTKQLNADYNWDRARTTLLFGKCLTSESLLRVLLALLNLLAEMASAEDI